MPVLILSVLQVSFLAGQPPVAVTHVKRNCFISRFCAPTLPKKRNKIKIGFELFKTLKLLAQFRLAFLIPLLSACYSAAKELTQTV